MCPHFVAETAINTQLPNRGGGRSHTNYLLEADKLLLNVGKLVGSDARHGRFIIPKMAHNMRPTWDQCRHAPKTYE